MLTILRDLFAHQEWADAEHYRAIEGFAGAAADSQILTRLHHYHLTQNAFLHIWHGTDIRMTTPEEFPSLGALKDYARAYHRDVAVFLERLDAALLSRAMDVPWFKKFPMQPTLAETMHQVILHSAQHRAQNASQLRSLGGQPPITDFILWVCSGKPAPSWD